MIKRLIGRINCVHFEQGNLTPGKMAPRQNVARQDDARALADVLYDKKGRKPKKIDGATR